MTANYEQGVMKKPKTNYFENYMVSVQFSMLDLSNMDMFSKNGTVDINTNL